MLVWKETIRNGFKVEICEAVEGIKASTLEEVSEVMWKPLLWRSLLV